MTTDITVAIGIKSSGIKVPCSYPHMLKVATLIKQTGALDALLAILSPVNNPSSKD